MTGFDLARLVPCKRVKAQVKKTGKQGKNILIKFCDKFTCIPNIHSVLSDYYNMLIY